MSFMSQKSYKYAIDPIKRFKPTQYIQLKDIYPIK